jgi:hypothetical protein
MANNTIKKIHKIRIDYLLTNYKIWAKKQNARKFGWFGLHPVIKYREDITLDTYIEELDDLPWELQNYIRSTDSCYPRLHSYFWKEWDNLETAENLFKMAKNIIKNNMDNHTQKIHEQIYLSMDDYKAISEK